MTIPLATTTVTVWSASEPEPGEGRTLTVRVAGVRAAITSPTGSELLAPGGGGGEVTAHLVADTVDLARTDVVVDDSDGTRFEVVWLLQRRGLGLDHTAAGLRHLSGVEQ